MTTRNFRVNNGLEVGDIVISASANTITGNTTAAPAADGQLANKKYVDDQDAAIATDTLTLSNKTLTAPKIVDAGFIADASGNEQIIFQTIGSAVNELEISNAASGNGPILGSSGETNVPINITAKGTGNILLNAGADVVIPANIGLQFVDANEKIESDGTDLTVNSGAKINLTATTDVHIPNAVGLVFGDGGEHIETNNTDFTITSGGKINLATASDVHMANDRGIVFGDAGEKIEGDGTDLTITSSGLLNLSAGTDVVIPINIGLHFTDANEKIESNGTNLTITAASGVIALAPNTDVTLPNDKGLIFGDAGEKIEGNGSKLVIASSDDIDLNAGAAVVIPINIPLQFVDANEKIASDGTDLTITAASGAINLSPLTDVVIPADKGITFGAGEKIEGDNTDLTITSGGAINLTAVTDIVVPAAVGITFGSGEKIEGDNTDLVITSGGDVTFTTTGNVNIATSKLLTFGDDGENISGDGTDITIASGADIDLNATGDVNIPANKGLTFGNDGEKIEGNGTNLIIASSGNLTLTATGETIITNNFRVAGNLTVDGTETIVNTATLSVEDNIIEINRNVSNNSGMPKISGLKVNRGETSAATEVALFWAWDETFADDGTTTHGNAGGAFTAFKRFEGNTSVPVDADLVDIRANVVHALSTSAQYADVAERFEADAPMTAGAVVMVGGDAEITETTADLSDQVFGVISDQPAYAMNAGAGNSESHPFVAMTGRTPVRVTGAVTKGQRLVSSSTKGCARAAATGETYSPFHVIGRALESSTDAGIKLVNCAVRTNN